MQIVNTIHRLHKDRLEWLPDHFDHLCGTDTICKAIIAGSSLEELKARWQTECQAFQPTRAKYPLYRE